MLDNTQGVFEHSLIADNEQIFFAKDYQKRINFPIITTGNELVKEQIGDFSKQLNINELYQYILDVDKCTTEILKSLSYESMRVKMTEEKREALNELRVVSEDENAFWLIDYWCGKDIRGLIQMPFFKTLDNAYRGMFTYTK